MPKTKIHIDILECAPKNTNPTGLAFVEGAVKRRDELLDFIQELARDGHVGFVKLVVDRQSTSQEGV